MSIKHSFKYIPKTQSKIYIAYKLQGFTQDNMSTIKRERERERERQFSNLKFAEFITSTYFYPLKINKSNISLSRNRGLNG